jgi:hypothetical protein
VRQQLTQELEKIRRKIEEEGNMPNRGDMGGSMIRTGIREADDGSWPSLQCRLQRTEGPAYEFFMATWRMLSQFVGASFDTLKQSSFDEVPYLFEILNSLMDEPVITELKIPNIPSVERHLRRKANQKKESIPELAHRLFQKKEGEKPYRFWLQNTIDFLKDNITILIMKDFLNPIVLNGSAAGIVPNPLEGVWENEEMFNAFIKELIDYKAHEDVINMTKAAFFSLSEQPGDTLSLTSVLTNQEDQSISNYKLNKDMVREYFLYIAAKEPEFTELEWISIDYSSPSSSSEMLCDYSGALSQNNRPPFFR